MNHVRIAGAAMLMSVLAAVPGLAQNTTGATPPASPGTASVAHSTPSQRNPVLADNGDSRAGKVIGSTVYSEQDKKLGSVDDILLGQGGSSPQAVISANGKLVLVPYSRLEFGNTKQSADNRVILRGETPDSLKKLPGFHYGKSGS